MTDLTLIRARDAELPAYKLMPRCGTHAFADRRALLALVDELQRERDKLSIDLDVVKFKRQEKLECEQARYDTLKLCYDGLLEAGNTALAERDLLRAALLDAKVAIEAGCTALCLVFYANGSPAEKRGLAYASQLRALVGLVG